MYGVPACEKQHVTSFFAILQAFVPNEVKLFGTGHKSVSKRENLKCGIYQLHKDIFITKTHIKALDQPSRPCTSQTTNPDTTTCIAKFIEGQIGCSPDIDGSQYPEGIPCDTKSHLQALANITRVFQNADESEIYKMTGCLSACEKDQYSLNADQWEKVYQGFGSQCEYRIRFKIMDRTYEEQEHYVIYDTDSFFADVGGFMGLLLGSSLLSLYNEMEGLLMKLLCRPHVGRHKN